MAFFFYRLAVRLEENDSVCGEGVLEWERKKDLPREEVGL